MKVKPLIVSPTRGENICGGLSLPLLRSARGIVWAREVKTAYPCCGLPESQQALNHDVFRSGRPKNMNVIDSKKLDGMRAENRTHFSSSRSRRNPPSSSPACRRSPSGTGRLSSSSFRRR
ncbi:hypothetical protein CN100_32315 [Sinorhizobium meliloti]|nr:hypothetical protein CN209_35995 [Sinorhizobium meliloti]RVH65153.1 hypothetical protein CN203_37025 [Sinorhizobium meliloti]RVN54848.1 hypothetical protein CN104_30650 [Sinorhizobium meliloti]RVO17794.1 hypothetical protein CN100_32315 [Sinorhizobium meliloti]